MLGARKNLVFRFFLGFCLFVWFCFLLKCFLFSFCHFMEGASIYERSVVDLY